MDIAWNKIIDNSCPLTPIDALFYLETLTVGAEQIAGQKGSQ